MIKTIVYNKEMDEFVVTLHIPKTMRGTYTYDEGMLWTQDAVCVWIDNSREDYALHHTTYLDYKDSLQATGPIFSFDNEGEATSFAKQYGLMIEYGSRHNFNF